MNRQDFFLRLCILFFLTIGCEEQSAITVTEPIGIARTSELITATINIEKGFDSNAVFVATDVETSATQPVQILDTSEVDGRVVNYYVPGYHRPQTKQKLYNRLSGKIAGYPSKTTSGIGR